MIPTTTSSNAPAPPPPLPYEILEDLLAHLVAFTLHHLDASTRLPTFLPAALAHTLLCTLPTPPARLTNLIFIRLNHCQPTALAARGDTHQLRRVAREHHLASTKYRHWHRSPWSLVRAPAPAPAPTPAIEWVQSVAAGASRGNKVDVLAWLTRQPEAAAPDVWAQVCASAAVVNVSSNPLVLASAYAAVGALEWWRDALREHGWMQGERAGKLAIECMALAAARGHLEAVAWWARQFEEERAGVGGLKRNRRWVWERVEAQVKRLGMDSEGFKRLAAVMAPPGGLVLRVGPSP